MTVEDIIKLAYSTPISDAVRESAFAEMVTEAQRRYDDADKRLTPTREDLNRVYSI